MNQYDAVLGMCYFEQGLSPATRHTLSLILSNPNLSRDELSILTGLTPNHISQIKYKNRALLASAREALNSLEE